LAEKQDESVYPTTFLKLLLSTSYTKHKSSDNLVYRLCNICRTYLASNETEFYSECTQGDPYSRLLSFSLVLSCEYMGTIFKQAVNACFQIPL